MQYDRMKLIVGVFVLTLFTTILISIFYLLDEKGTFDKRYKYHFQTESASSFNVGMPLKFSGFNIGVIDNIELNDDGTVFMTFYVDSKNRKWIAKDSVLMVKKPLIGSPHIEVHSTMGNKVLKEGSILTILMSDDINDMISKLEPVVDKIINIIDSIDKITTNISKEDSDLFLTLKNIEKFSRNISKSDSLLTTVTGDEKSTQNLIKTIDSISKIMEDINKITSTLDSTIITPTSSTIKELDLIMKDVKQKLDTLDSTVKAVGSYDKDIMQLKEQISVGITKSNQIMDKVDSMMQDDKNVEVKLP